MRERTGERKKGDTGTPAGAPPAATTSQEQPPSAGAGVTVSESAFAQEHERQAQGNERLNEKYDRIIASLQDAIADPFPEDLVKREEALRARYDELRLRASEARRAGKDMFMPALVLRQFPAKLALAHASREPKEYELASVLLDQARFEIDEAEAAPVVDVKREVLRLAGTDDVPAERRGTLKKGPTQGMEKR